MSDQPAATSASREKFRVLVVAILGAGIVFLDTSIVNVALPSIQRSLGLSTSMQQWAASAYLLTLSALLLVGGRVADLFGRKRMFLIGLASYAVLAIVAGLSPNGITLVFARGLQGVAGAFLVPTTLALINAAYPPGERGAAIGQWSAWSGITTVLGPIIGGLVIDHLSWRFAFFITPTIAILAFTLALRIGESRDETASGRIDLVGVGLLVASVGGMVFALIQGPVAGWRSPVVVAPAIVGALLVPVFLLWERRAPVPLLPFAMFSNRNLGIANLVTLFVYAGLYGTFFYVSLYVQSALGASATIAASVFIPITILLFFLSPYAGRLNDRFGPRWLLTFGPLTAAAGLLVVSLTGPGQIFTVMMPGVIVFGIGMGFTVAPVTTTAIGSAEERFSGAASGFNNAVSRVAGLIAIAAMGVIVIGLWRAGLAVAARGAPADVAAALSSVSAKAFVIPSTKGMSPAQAAELVVRARRAAEAAFRNGVSLAAMLVALGGVTGAIFLRNPPRDNA